MVFVGVPYDSGRRPFFCILLEDAEVATRFLSLDGFGANSL